MDALKYLLATYFHQDWDHDHEDWEQVVDDFMTDDQATVRAVPDEIDLLLSAHPGDESLSEALVRLGCDYDPPEGDRVWLVAVRDRITSRTQG